MLSFIIDHIGEAWSKIAKSGGKPGRPAPRLIDLPSEDLSQTKLQFRTKCHWLGMGTLNSRAKRTPP